MKDRKMSRIRLFLSLYENISDEAKKKFLKYSSRFVLRPTKS